MPDKKAKICPKCGFKNPFSLSTCWHCNAALKKRRTLYTVYRAKEWWNRQDMGVKTAIGITVCFIGVLLIIGIVGMSDTEIKTTESTPTPEKIENKTIVPEEEKKLKEQQKLNQSLLKVSKIFLKEINDFYDDDGITTGYLLDTVKIMSVDKISDNKAKVWISVRRIGSIPPYDTFEESWKGTFIKMDEEWKAGEDFMRTDSYNIDQDKWVMKDGKIVQ